MVETTTQRRPANWLYFVAVGALTFNVVGLIAGEVQRRALVYRQTTENEKTQQELREIKSRLEQIAVLQSSVRAMEWLQARAFVQIGASAGREQLEREIVNRLNAGRDVIVQFDENATEDRDSSGAIRCGADSGTGYLGVFVAGQRYRIRFDPAAKKWIGSGPNQEFPLDSTTQTCGTNSVIYGDAELRAEVRPAPDHGLVLWGARLSFAGQDVFFGDRRVGTIGWLD